MTEENVFIVDVEDGNTPLKDVFKPDYAKARELEAGRIRVTDYQRFAVRKLVRIIRNSGIQQKGINFIKRRMVIFGMSEIEKEFTKEIKQLEEEFNIKFDVYSKRISQQLLDKRTVGDINGKREILYLDDTDFGRLKELSDVMNVTHDSIERLSINYTIMYLGEYFDENLLDEVRLDIEELREYMGNTVNL